jgi:hypothetical protein
MPTRSISRTAQNPGFERLPAPLEPLPADIVRIFVDAELGDRAGARDVLTYWRLLEPDEFATCVWISTEGRTCVCWRGRCQWIDALAPAEAIRRVCLA